MSQQVTYKSSLYDLISVKKNQVDVDNGKLIVRTTDDGIELGKKLLFKNRPLGLGVETDVIGSNSVFTVNENIPASYIHIDAPSNSSNVWMIAVDGDYINNGTSQNDYARTVHIGANGTVYSAYEYDYNRETFIRNPDGSTFYVPEMGLSNQGNYVVVAKHEPSGVPNWFRVIGASNLITEDYIFAPSVSSDSVGNVYVSGQSGTITCVFDSNLNEWWNSSSTYDQTNENDVSYGGGGYIVKYDAQGTPQWVSYIKSTDYTNIHRNVLDESSNALYVVGDTYSALQSDNLLIYNADGSITSNQINNDSRIGFIMKYNLDGNAQWINKIDGINFEFITQLALDNDHNIVFASLIDSTTNAPSVVMQSQDGNDITVAGTDGCIIGKYDSAGNAIWGTNIQNAPGNYGEIVIQAIAVNANNDIFVTLTSTVSEILIGPNSITGVENAYVLIKIGNYGDYQWSAYVANTSSESSELREKVKGGLVVDSYDNIYVTPRFYFHDNITVYNADGSSNIIVLPDEWSPDLQSIHYNAHVLQFNADGHYVKTIAHMDANAIKIMDMDIDESRRRLYVGTYAYSDGPEYSFTVFNHEQKQVYNFSNIDYVAGFLMGLNMDTGDVVPSGAIVKLPAHQSDSFQKDIFFTTANTTPYTTYLELENRDHSIKYMPVTLEQSNVTVQKSFRWTSNSWVATSQFEPTVSGVNLVSCYYGDQEFYGTGSNYIGSTIAWQNKVIDNKLAFRVTTKCSLASDDEIAYRHFEGLVSPVDNLTSNMPYGIVSSEIGDTVGTVFSDLHHTITRNSDRSVDLKVGWNTNSSNYVGNIELHVLASTRLGDITFNPIHG